MFTNLFSTVSNTCSAFLVKKNNNRFIVFLQNNNFYNYVAISAHDDNRSNVCMYYIKVLCTAYSNFSWFGNNQRK